ncbi:hypothetical protein DPEC_G00293280 [Dallia pectoralis]|uniref:Uncharacterized protein n=1 Tax=Dallia pectoralis TaxID=75939 RepID=A0ACC2FI51_DALPE|nr:hypothetical protein DPEC_G00293280 [Dallia pectoralis]
MATAGKVIKCQAAVAWEQNKPLVMEEIEVAPPQANEIRIKVVATGVCHSDLYHLFEGKQKAGFPCVLGHEGAGIVESVGSGVTNFKPGDKVIPLFVSQCGQCRFCKSPKTNQCEKGWASERFTAMSSSDTRLTSPLNKVCLLGCGVATGYGAAINTAKVEPGSTCAVFGLGAVGLAAVMGCKNAGAKRIIAVDINPAKYEKAKVFGATEFVNPKDHDKPISQVLHEMTDGGVDFSLECVGNVAVMRSALESCVKGWGVSVLVGWTDLDDFSARPIQLISGRTWKGSLFGGFKSKDSVPQLVNDYLQKKVKLDEFITHNMTLAQVNSAIDLMKTGGCIRTILSVSPE